MLQCVENGLQFQALVLYQTSDEKKMEKKHQFIYVQNADVLEYAITKNFKKIKKVETMK